MSQSGMFLENSLVLKARWLEKLERYFGKDFKRIRHARRVLKYAEALMEKEPADRIIVTAAAIFHDVGIKAAERKYGHCPGYLQEQEGPPIAARLLRGCALPAEQIREICEIIAHHHSPRKITTDNFKVLYDADRLVNLKDEIGVTDRIKLKNVIEKIFLTRTGRSLARSAYLRV